MTRGPVRRTKAQRPVAKKSVPLSVTTDAPTAEIAVIGPDFELREKAIGALNTTLPPAIYMVKVRLGRETQERNVVLEEATSLRFSMMESLASPVPIYGTARSHEYQANGAADESRKVHERIGEGAEIFFCARYWAHEADKPAQKMLKDARHPAEGLRLYRRDTRGDRRIVDFSRAGSLSRTRDPWSACTVSVDPGAYEIGWINDAQGREYRFSVIASERWQTQVFLRRRVDEMRDGFQAKALSDIAITMRKRASTQGAPDWQDYMLMDSARIALSQKRMLMSDQMANLFLRKFENPMLGILGLHLLLQAKALQEQAALTPAKSRINPGNVLADAHLFGEVIGNLRRLLGRRHPDVEALALQDPETAGGARTSFKDLPMLRASWELMVSRSHEHEQAVSLDLWKRAALATDLGPYLIWEDNRGEQSALPRALQAGVESVLEQEARAARPRPGRRGARAQAAPNLSLVTPERAAIALNVPLSAARAILRQLN